MIEITITILLKAIIMKKKKKHTLLHNYYKCFSLNIYSQKKARVATADKNMTTTLFFVDAIKLI
jgi:hypothetical protein